MCGVAAVAQVKEMPKTPPTPLNAKTVDINSAAEMDIAAIGIERPIAKKIVEGRPYRNKRDLVTRQLLTKSIRQGQGPYRREAAAEKIAAMYARMVIGEALDDDQVREFARIYTSEVLPELKVSRDSPRRNHDRRGRHDGGVTDRLEDAGRLPAVPLESLISTVRCQDTAPARG